MRFFWLLPLTRRQVLLGFLWPAVLTALFSLLLLRYWSFYHLGTPGSFLFVVMFVAPVGLLASVVAQWAAMALLWRLAVVTQRVLPIATALVVLLFVGAFAFELSRTSQARSGEGPGAGDLAPFARSLVGLK